MRVAPFPGSSPEMNKKEKELICSIHCPPLPNCGCNVNNCLSLQPHPPYHDGLTEPELVLSPSEDFISATQKATITKSFRNSTESPARV